MEECDSFLTSGCSGSFSNFSSSFAKSDAIFLRFSSLNFRARPEAIEKPQNLDVDAVESGDCSIILDLGFGGSKASGILVECDGFLTTGCCGSFSNFSSSFAKSDAIFLRSSSLNFSFLPEAIEKPQNLASVGISFDLLLFISSCADKTFFGDTKFPLEVLVGS